jgi:hypothetical protein
MFSGADERKKSRIAKIGTILGDSSLVINQVVTANVKWLMSP